jgi:dTDP-4-dehydrorhamnose reductase
MKIVVVGSGGRLGAALTRTYCQKFELVAFDRSNLDLSSSQQIRRKLDQLDFDILVNAAAFTNVDLCESQREQAFAINAEAPKHLAEICSGKKAKLIQLKWKPRHDFKEGLEATIQWYIDNQSWWQPLLERAGRY